ncbi:Replicase polyprotein 1ab [Frankliniella fusca]|uniref:Replicase polyprotein 1ab n=1 Tax=Frankliniella fusca TaxID=407009 RepID=A0AAE1HKE9_9NEOP|nr:Replicase polyprotein 1ab [Frankliniella fusca]
MLVFPQDNTSTTAAPASTATEPTATTAAVPTVPAQVEDAASVDDGDDKLELASERKETRESAPSHLNPNVIVPDATKLASTTASDFTPAATAVTVTTNTITSTPAPSAAASDSTPDASPVTVTTTTTTTTTSAAARATPHATPSSTPTTTPTPGTPAAPTPSPAFHRWKQEPGAYRQDIFKKYANKYASSRPPPVSFFRKDGSGSAAKRRTGGDDGDLETGASEMQHAVLPTVQAPWHTAAGRMRAPPPLYIPARLHAARPPQSFPSLPPNGMQPMLVAMPTRMAVLNGTRQAGPADTEAAPVSASSDAASLPERLPEGEALPQAQPEVRPEASQVTTAPAPRGRGRVRHGRPAGAGATTGTNTPVDIAASAMTELGVHPVETQRTHIRRRPLRNRQQAPDVLATTSTPEPASTPGTHGRPQDTPRVRPRPTVRPAAPQMYTILRPLMALRERLPGVRPTSTETPASTEATQALTGDEAATIKKITALQSGASGAELGPQGRMARLSSLQSMLVANLVAIQRELAERHADLRRHMDSLHLPAEHRAQGGGQAARTFTREAEDTSEPAVHSASTTTGPMRRRYRRPPALRVPKPPAPAEDKEQAARDNKVSYRTLYKKRTGVPTGKVRFGETLSTSTTTTATSTTTNAAPSTTAAATAATSIDTRTTPFFDHQTTTDEPSALTEAVVETTTTSEVQEDLPAPTTAPAEEAAGDQQASSTTSKINPSAPPAAASSTTKTVLEAASASADVPADFTAEGSAPAAVAAAAALTADAASPLLVPVVPATLPGAARVLREDLLGFQASPPDPVHRPGGGLGRLTLLGGVLPEDDPAVAGGLFGLDRHGRGAFRAPLQMEGGFVPVIPGSALSLQQPAGAPQIVGPIPGGYRDVLRGSPVQLDLPRPDRPSDFLGRPVVAGTAPAQAAPPARHVTRVMTRIPVRATAVAAPLRQG